MTFSLDREGWAKIAKPTQTQKPHLTKQQRRTIKIKIRNEENINRSQPSPDPNQKTVKDFYTTQNPKQKTPSSHLTAFPFDVSMSPLDDEKSVGTLPPPKKLKETPLPVPESLPDSDTSMSISTPPPTLTLTYTTPSVLGQVEGDHLPQNQTF